MGPADAAAFRRLRTVYQGHVAEARREAERARRASTEAATPSERRDASVDFAYWTGRERYYASALGGCVGTFEDSAEGSAQ